MTSALRGGGVPSKADIVSNLSKGGCVILRTGGVKKSENFEDVIYGCPLTMDAPNQNNVLCSLMWAVIMTLEAGTHVSQAEEPKWIQNKGRRLCLCFESIFVPLFKSTRN